jgi:uncharacterized protein (DUF433 family)
MPFQGILTAAVSVMWGYWFIRETKVAHDKNAGTGLPARTDVARDRTVFLCACSRAEGNVSLKSASLMNLERLGRITVEEGKCGGRPCIRGQRIRVTDVLQLLGAGTSFEEILADYPSLEREDILAAIDYAAHQTDHFVLRTS